MKKVVYNIPIVHLTEDEARERIRKLLRSYDPDYWLMKFRKQKLDKLTQNVNTKGCK